MKHAALLFAALVAVAACAGDDADAEWTTVRVVVADDAPALESICIDDECRTFEPDVDARQTEFSAMAQPGAEFEILQVGGGNSGAGGTADVGGCILVELTATMVNFGDC